MLVTRYITGDSRCLSRRESQPPYRPDPNRTGPSTSFGSPSIHIVTQVTREAAPEQSVASGVEWMGDFDFEAEVPCESQFCQREINPNEHPAELLVRSTCPDCGALRTAAWCRKIWEVAHNLSGFVGLYCFRGHGPFGRDDVMRIVEVLR